jgi:hypothetical protein
MTRTRVDRDRSQRLATIFGDGGNPDGHGMVVFRQGRPGRRSLGRRAAGQDPQRQSTTDVRWDPPPRNPFRIQTGVRAGADRCAYYLTTLAAYLRDNPALAHGWPLATGVIEGICRNPVADRLDLTGARWARPAQKPSCGYLPPAAMATSMPIGGSTCIENHESNHENRYQQTQNYYQLIG